MIIFEKISWKNFLSTGNQKTEIVLSKDKTNLIVGTNGAGKSTILDALTFSLFGKPFRKINKPQLLNNVNEKECLVDIEFSIGNTKWKVSRGIKPSVFNIYKDGKVLDQLNSVNDQQKWLEQNVLKMNYKSFTQIVILGSSAFIPFMQLSTPHRREVIEDLLDIKIFSQMSLISKENIKLIKSNISTLELKKDSFEDKIKMQKEFISEIETRGKKYIEEKTSRINILTEEQTNIGKENNNIELEIVQLKDSLKVYSKTLDKIKQLNGIKDKITGKIQTLTEEHKFFNTNTTCPTCEQSLDDSFRANKISEIKTKAKELEDGYSDLKKLIEDERENEKKFIEITDKITSCNNKISQNNFKISSIQEQIKSLNKDILDTSSGISKKTEEYDKLKEFEIKYNEIVADLNDNKNELRYYVYISDLLKDNGIKTKVIKKYLPLINKEINRYLQMMDFYINFSFDEEFNESICSPVHEDFTYSSFSEGEKTRINLALIFAWREVARFKNSVNTNLLIIDEVFDSSLDEFGTDDFLKIIKYVVTNTNVFVISHKENLHDHFQKVIKFEKKKGFSHMKTLT
jgi:DNA repair exonuclease SbcCD ATPase subunit